MMPDAMQGPPGLMLRALSQMIRSRLGTRLSEIGLTVTWYAVLNVLERGEAETGADLSRHFSTDPTAITRTIDRLVAAGLVKREKHSTDRRRYAIVLTPKAHQLLPKARSFAGENEDLFFGVLEEDERQVFEALLVKLVDNAGKVATLIDWE
jgi:DNA-binding MarR family transcriptional regulator